ncbi:Phage terminase, large subunit [hydrothermal vent metagenome]|uniref:Phage terminase, large subunit n=1 Tax=hydrothermal vent metagenome TaxID=652676 RepID=A0A1W1D088_9ZZZZ
MMALYQYGEEFKRAWWHELVAYVLTDIIKGEGKPYTSLSFAPRHRKTTFGVRWFASYGLGMSYKSEAVKNTLKFIYATYGGDLSTKTSAETKAIVESDIFKFVFSEAKIKKDSDSKGDWNLVGNKGFFATSVGGAGTGVGADVYIADDLIKALEEGSHIVRDRAWKFYEGSVETRLEGLKRVLFIGQRLDEDDVIGRLKKWIKDNDMQDSFSEISISALNKEDKVQLKVNAIVEISKEVAYALVNREGEKLFVSHDAKEFKQLDHKAYLTFKANEKVFVQNRGVAEIDLFISLEESYSYRDLTVTRPPYTPLDESLFSRKELELKRLNRDVWDKQYMGDTRPSRAGYFLESDWREIVPHEIPNGYRYIIVDPSKKKISTADDCAIGVYNKSVGENKIVKTVLEDGVAEIMNTDDICDQIIRFGIKYPDAQIFVENAGGGEAVETRLPEKIMIYNAEAQRTGKAQFTNSKTFFNADNSEGAKNRRINLIQEPISQGYFLVNKFMDETFKVKVKKQLLAYNPMKTNNDDNIIDTAGMSYKLSSVVARSTVERVRKERVSRKVGIKKSKRGWKLG